MMNKKNDYVKKMFCTVSMAVCFTLAVLTLSSCDSSVSIKANKDCSSDFQIEADFGKVIYETIKAVTLSISQMSSTSIAAVEETPILSAAKIKEALSSGDVKGLEVSTPTASSISISGTVLAPSDQKSVLESNDIKIANIITCTKNTLTLIIAPSTVENLFSSLPEDQQSYMDLLMAPVLTGEQMSEEDYISLIGAVYGEEMQKELQKAVVKITLMSPDGVALKKAALSETKNVKTSSNKAVFSVSLAEFLTLNSARTFSISW